MSKYILKRISLALLTFIAIYVIVYLIMAKFGKNPYEILAQNNTGSKGDKSPLEDARREGLLDPAIVRLWRYTVGIFNGDWGKVYSKSVNDIPTLFFGPLRYSLLVSIPAFILSSTFGITFGIIAAYKRGKWQDGSITLFATIFVALPSFVLAPLMIIIASFVGLPFEFKPADETSIGTMILSLVVPIATMTLGSLAGYTFLVRNQIISTLTSNQVLIAKSKGMSTFQIFRKHVLRNSSIPLARVMLFSYVGLLSGSIILEQFFRIPGSASIIVSAAQDGEINISMFSLIFFTSLSLMIEIVSDILYAVMDPRIKIASSNYKFIKHFKHKKIREKSLEEEIKEKEVL